MKIGSTFHILVFFIAVLGFSMSSVPLPNKTQNALTP